MGDGVEFGLVLEGFSAGSYIGDLSPEKVAQAARRAINKIADRTRTRADRAVREQIAFPAQYLGPAAKRLWVETKASRVSLEAVIRGQGRPTSLATFSKSKVLPAGQRHKDGKVDVMVEPGRTKYIRRAFIIKLKNDNRGLAVRTSGGPPVGAYKPRAITDRLWLLYGPSVNQALISARQSGIYEDLGPETLDALEAEFFRLIALEESNG